MTDEINSNSGHQFKKLTEINILLNSYNDLFSDFDPSAYPERILSDDFIIQAKTISHNKSGNNMSLRLLIPESKRNEQDEGLIIERLNSYF